MRFVVLGDALTFTFQHLRLHKGLVDMFMADRQSSSSPILRLSCTCLHLVYACEIITATLLNDTLCAWYFNLHGLTCSSPRIEGYVAETSAYHHGEASLQAGLTRRICVCVCVCVFVVVRVDVSAA